MVRGKRATRRSRGTSGPPSATRCATPLLRDIRVRDANTAPNRTYEMDADALAEIGHQGFVTDAEAMAATLFDFATHADYRAAALLFE